ncbi:hypothetical protein [Micromonospora sp. 4G55]|uniref:hypothetical protein n=1 Tax=Micromonospora sp. 4G55 TaxID=2806102 RepID=UPI001A5EBCDC|nr:hypothetical protein [Micromonospora sp. 4G55]MBM0256318.1 hypothetical protein [Micromonospora sp. 4G55]
MIRTLAAISLLLVSGCAPTDAAASAPASPSEPPDRYASSACTLAAQAVEEQDLRFGAGTRPASRAVESTDPGIREAGRQLMVAGLKAEELLVKNDPNVDPGPTNARLAEAQRQLLSACTDLFGPQPWPFAKQPSPRATS